MRTLRDLFEHELQDIHTAEYLLLDGLQPLAKAATDSDAERAFLDHRTQTQEHIRRIETVASDAGITLRRTSCPGMEGLLKEQQAFAGEQPDAELLHLFNLWAAQKAERYEMTAYESLIALAEELGLANAAEQFTATLDEEEAALNTLKELAEEFDTSVVPEDEAESRRKEEEAPVRRS